MPNTTTDSKWPLVGSAVTLACAGAALAYMSRSRPKYSWMESVLGDDCLGWVKKQNNKSISSLGDPTKSALYKKLLAIYDSKDKIPYVSKIGDHYYNFWRDEKNTKGIWRKATLEEYKKPEPKWTTVLDLDMLGEKENENWVWKGHKMLDEGPDKPRQLTMLSLSRGDVYIHTHTHTHRYHLQSARLPTKY
jgi:prolyl oligopeptidase